MKYKETNDAAAHLLFLDELRATVHAQRQGMRFDQLLPEEQRIQQTLARRALQNARENPTPRNLEIAADYAAVPL